MKLLKGLVLAFVAVLSLAGSARSFEIGETDFLLDGKPFVLRCGEVHYARIPRDYWQHRLRMLRAMGCNAVGCYMFWNFHEREPGKFTWEGRADAAAFCKLAQEEGLWVILRPGPYACAEWEGGGAPWWLMADDLVDAKTSSRQKGISMRSSDPRWVEPAKRWIAEVGRRLAPLQVTKGGPILMVQVENEYGLHGNDTNYIRTLRQATLDAGFEVPLYACNPPRVIQNGFVPELFQAANFGADPKQRFEIIRQWQPKGPLMCSEYYPAWFDTWGQAHHPPKRDREFFGPIDWMLAHRASFSLYMAHGGTSFGGWTGCRNPFVPNVTSYDFEAPINEHGAANPSFAKFRDRCAKHLNPGETIPPMPAPIPTVAFGTVRMEPFASLDALVTREVPLDSPVYMERLGQGFGLVSYERWLEPGEGGMLNIDEVHDFGYVFLDGQYLGTLDRRHRGVKVAVPKGTTAGKRRLQIVLEPMGRINSSTGMEDRKGLDGCVRLGGKVVKGWTARMMPIDPDGFTVPSCVLADGAGQNGLVTPRPGTARGTGATRGTGTTRGTGMPTLYRGTLAIPQPQPHPSTSTSSQPSTSSPADTFIDMTTWTKGVVWVNGHNLGRFWSIGPQQTLYVPGCWLKFGENEVVILDFFGPRQASEVVFREKPILDVLQPETDFNRKARTTTKFVGGTEVASGTFPNTDEAQVVMFEKSVRGTTFTFQARTTYDAKNLASIAEFDLLDRDGNPLTSLGLRVTGVDSEEEVREDGVAENAIDGQVEACWTTSSRTLPHWIEFQTPNKVEIFGFRYTPRQKSVGRIKEWSLFIPARDLQAEIDAVAAAGGGTLSLGPGVYRTGALFFKPGVNLHLDKGATIVGVDGAEGYPMRETRIEGETCLYYPALINADGCDGFTISGEGVIDGHGANTWEEFWTRRAAARKSGEDFRNKTLMRPRLLYVSNSKNVDVSGVTFKNSKFWTTHFYDCEDVIVHDCTIVAEILTDSHGKKLKGPSTDAVDIDKCRRFTVRNCVIAVNDDGVVVKGGKGAWANDYTKFPGNGPSSDVLVEGCTFLAPTHSALTLGSECPAAKGITMRNCTVEGVGNLLNLKMRTDTPQTYEDVLVEGVAGSCATFLNAQTWTQYENLQGRTRAELLSTAKNVTMRKCTIACQQERKMGKGEDIYRLENIRLVDNEIKCGQ